MLLKINFLFLLVSVVFATPPISYIDEKGLKSDTDDKLTNSIDDSLDDRPKRSYDSGGYQWGSYNQADSFNPAYSPPNNYFGSGRNGNDYPGSSNPFQQSPFDRGQPNNNYGKNPLQDVMGKALESVIVQSVRHLLDMTPLGSGQGDFMRSARSARSVENVLKISDNKEEKPGKVNFIEKLGSMDEKDSHSLEKREAFSVEDDDSIEDPELIRQQILQQNIMKEMKRRRRMRQQAYQQSVKKNQEKIESQRIKQQKDSGESWEQGMNDEQKLEYLSNYQKQLIDLYREKQNKARVDRNVGKIPGSSKQSSSRYSSPQQARTLIGDSPIDRQEVFSKYDQRKNKVKPFLSSKYSQNEKNNSRFRKEGFEQEQGFIRQNVEEAPQNFMMNYMGQSSSDWSQQTRDQSNQFVQQQGRIKDNSIKKLSNKSMLNRNQRIKPEGEVVSMQEGWTPQIQQIPQNQQIYNEFLPQNSMMSQQIPQTSNGIPGKQRFQRISTNEICKNGFTPSGIPCSMDTTQNQMSDGSFVNSPSDQEMLLQPPTLIKRYVTYSNRFIPPPTAVMEPVTDQEMLSGEGKPQNNFERTNSIGSRFSDDGYSPSQEQRSQTNEGMMNGWTGQ